MHIEIRDTYTLLNIIKVIHFATPLFQPDVLAISPSFQSSNHVLHCAELSTHVSYFDNDIITRRVLQWSTKVIVLLGMMALVSLQ